MTSRANARSDYLDTSNPVRLKAFFMFCDVANNARAYIAALNVDDSPASRVFRGVMDAMRQQATQRALDALSGQSDFFALIESSLSSEE